MEEAERVADRIAVIDHGRIIAEGTAAALRDETGGRTLEDAFIALTGRSIREAEARQAADDDRDLAGQHRLAGQLRQAIARRRRACQGGSQGD
jgi:ABC-type multidrug transport system ATPase subunit